MWRYVKYVLGSEFTTGLARRSGLLHLAERFCGVRKEVSVRSGGVCDDVYAEMGKDQELVKVCDNLLVSSFTWFFKVVLSSETLENLGEVVLLGSFLVLAGCCWFPMWLIG